MTFTRDEFAQLRPFAHHLTSATNIVSIRKMRCLRCARVFIESSGQNAMVRQRRQESCSLEIMGSDVQLQNQSPLHAGNIAFEGGWNLCNLVERLNGLVFFWPGTESGPNKYGANHFESRLWGERPIVLRMRTSDLFKSNPDNEPLFCRFNSGSPRRIPPRARASPRGPDTFLSAADFRGTRCEVVELVFPGSVRLPDTTECGLSLEGPWQKFF